MKRPNLMVALGLLAASGCGAPEEFRSEPARALASAARPTAPAQAASEAAPMPKSEPALALAAPPGGPGPAPAPAVPAFQAAPTVPRKIIYNADLAVTVEQFAVAERALGNLLKDYGGFIAQSDIAGSGRSGRWTARVPAEQIDPFEQGVAALGEVQKRHRDSRDVTAEYFDIEARIKNKKVEESRLLKHLEDSTGNLREILEIEREVARVRGEVEQYQGQLQLLANLSSLATVTISLVERDRTPPPEPPRPPRPPEVPTFAQRLGATYQGSVDRLLEFGEVIALAIVAAAPWIPVVALAILVLWVVGRRLDPRTSSAAEGSRP